MKSAACAVLCALIAACASTPRAPQNAAAAEQFEQLKTLEGEWIATEGGDAPAGSIVRYHVTGAGSALVETLFADTPHEMVTVYYLDQGALTLTHYCAAANQPRMIAEAPTAPDEIRFRFAGGTNITDKGLHMHEAEVHFVDAAHLESRWTAYVVGKPDHTARFVLARSWR